MKLVLSRPCCVPFSDPLGVFDIRLPSRHSFDLLCIDHQHDTTAFRASLNTGFQYTPVAIFGDVRTSLFFEPIAEL